MGASFSCVFLPGGSSSSRDVCSSPLATLSPVQTLRRKSSQGLVQAAGAGATLIDACLRAVVDGLLRGRIGTRQIHDLPHDLLQLVIDRLVQQGACAGQSPYPNADRAAASDTAALKIVAVARACSFCPFASTCWIVWCACPRCAHAFCLACTPHGCSHPLRLAPPPPAAATAGRLAGCACDLGVSQHLMEQTHSPLG